MRIYECDPFVLITSDEFSNEKFAQTYKPLTKAEAKKFAKYIKKEISKINPHNCG